MRYYIPLRGQEEKARAKNLAPSLLFPLWGWIVLIVIAMLVVLALR